MSGELGVRAGPGLHDDGPLPARNLLVLQFHGLGRKLADSGNSPSRPRPSGPGDGAVCPVLVTDAWTLRLLGLRAGDRVALVGHFRTSVVSRPQRGYDRRPWFVCRARAVKALARDEKAHP